MNARIKPLPLFVTLLVTSLASAESKSASDYAGSRVQGVFQAVAEMPQVASVGVPLAVKGDLPGCIGPFRSEIQDECLDAAYEVESRPVVIVETRRGAMSMLTRYIDFAVAANLTGSNQK